MNNSDSAICCVDTLASCSTRSEGVNAKVFWVNVQIQLFNKRHKKLFSLSNNV